MPELSRAAASRGATRAKATVLIVDDHPIVRQGLAQLINQAPDMVVCGQAGDAHQALEMIRRLRPRVAVVDVSLGQASGIELVKDIRLRWPKLAVLMLSVHDESLYAERGIRAGAQGYVMKEEATDHILRAIRHVLQGRIYLSDRLKERLLRQSVGARPAAQRVGVERLSDRELEVFRLIGLGLATRQVAQQLCVSVKTVEAYRQRIKEKLGLENATQMIRQAIQWAMERDGSRQAKPSARAPSCDPAPPRSARP